MEFHWFGFVIPIAGTADLCFAITAVVITLALYLYPLLIILVQRSTEGLILLPPCPLIATHVACHAWYYYSVGSDQHLLYYSLLIVHGVGIAISYLSFRIYWDITTNNNCFILACTTFVNVMVFFVVPGFSGYYFDPYWPYAKRVSYYGPMLLLFGIIMYASNLPAIVDAYRTRRTTNLPFGLCILFSLHAVAWFTYAFYGPVKDHYIAITAGVGIILGSVQVFLCTILRVKCRSDSGAVRTPLLPQETQDIGDDIVIASSIMAN